MSDPNPEPGPPPGADAPVNWREAICELLATRAELIRLESSGAARHATRKGLLVGIIAGAAFFTWALALAGLVPLVAAAAGCAWTTAALWAAGLHLIAAVVAIVLLRRPAPPAFPITRAEFQRDREWLTHLKTPPSNP